jgi:hypothetical protein
LEFRDKIAEFLNNELKLELSLDKTKITNLHSDKGQFLGFYFRTPWNRNATKESKISVLKKNKNNHIRKSKISPNRMWLMVPVDRILIKLANEGFLKEYSQGSSLIPSAKNSWIYLDHPEIITRYNLLTSGLLNYYSIATNRNVFQHIVFFILKHSCAKTLARKLNLKSRAKVFSKFGILLTSPNEPQTSFHTESNFKKN